jgi:hypothetical protein
VARADLAKAIAALMFREREFFDRGLAMLSEKLGNPDLTGAPVPFTTSSYYEEEMGPGLTKAVASFPRLMGPHKLPWLKAVATAVEKKLSLEGRRRVNIDPGYVDFYKVVLASSKCGWPKVYLGRGTWADPVLRFYAGGFEPFPWTFPDFKDGRYDKDLRAIRDLYRRQMRGREAPGLPRTDGGDNQAHP